MRSLPTKKPHDGKENYTLIKLDMTKAFDKVEWNFIKGVMVKLGFLNGLILLCIVSLLCLTQ